MSDQVAALIEKLSAKLGVTAEYLWGVLIRQAAIDGLMTICLAVSVIAGVVFVWRKALAIEDDFNKKTAIVVCGVVSALALVFVALLISNSVTALINPEYWALKQIIK